MMTRGFANAKPPKPQHSWEGIEDDAPPVLEQQGLAPRMGSSIGKNGAKSPWFSRKKKTKKTMVFDRKKKLQIDIKSHIYAPRFTHSHVADWWLSNLDPKSEGQHLQIGHFNAFYLSFVMGFSVLFLHPQRISILEHLEHGTKRCLQKGQISPQTHRTGKLSR